MDVGARKEAIAVFPYTAQHSDELTLRVGDLITGVVQVQDGWCRGTLKGRKGLFPDNFVELGPVGWVTTSGNPLPAGQSRLTRANHTPTTSQMAVMRRGSSTSINSGIELTTDQVAVAKHPYESQADDEHSLRVGDVITDIRKLEEGWMVGNMNGITAAFPANFVKVHSNQTSALYPKPSRSMLKPPVTQRTKLRPLSSPESQSPIPPHVDRTTKPKEGQNRHTPGSSKKPQPPPKPGATPAIQVDAHSSNESVKEDDEVQKLYGHTTLEAAEGQQRPVSYPPALPSKEDKRRTLPTKFQYVGKKAVVTHPYLAQHSSEINLKEGEKVEIIAEEEEGWWRGKVGHKEGVFPSNFVAVLNDQRENHSSDATGRDVEKSTTGVAHKAQQHQPKYSQSAQKYRQKGVDYNDSGGLVMKPTVATAHEVPESIVRDLKAERDRAVKKEHELEVQLSEALETIDKLQRTSQESTQRTQNEMAVLKQRLTDLEMLVQTHIQGDPLDQPFWVVQKEEIHILPGRTLGKGGWGHISVAVFRGQEVAAKTLHSDILCPHNIKLFTREMNMAARSRHPNLLQFIGATISGEPIILTELMQTSLRKLLAEQVLSNKHILSIAKDVARALNYLHQTKPSPIIHRDISSANILLDKMPNDEWKAKVGDYGSSNFMAQVSTTGPGNIVYAAPEAYIPNLQSPKMDVFSFGVLLIEMSTLQLPEKGAREVLKRQIKWPKLVALVDRCTLDDHKKRPDMNKVLNDLEGMNVFKNVWM